MKDNFYIFVSARQCARQHDGAGAGGSTVEANLDPERATCLCVFCGVFVPKRVRDGNNVTCNFSAEI